MRAVFTSAVNARVLDEDGNSYIDFLSACGSLNYGHNHPRLKARLIEFLNRDGLLNGLDLHTSAKRDFLKAFRDIVLAPRGLDYKVQFTGPTGTNAVEAALKLARKVTGRQAVVAFTNAFHGMSLGALAAGARQQNRAAGEVRAEGITRLPYDGYHGAGTAELDRYAAMVEDPSGGVERPAAFIVETIQGEGGLNVASTEWLRHLAHVAKRLGALLIVDEVQAGCGRSGDFFSFESAGLEPDLVCIAKSIGGIGLPMALVLIRPQHDVWAPGEHNGTFRGNNLAFVAATAALEFWREPEFIAGLAANVARVRDWLDAVAADLGPARVRVKGRGLMIGLAFEDHAMAKRVAADAFRAGLLIETSGPHGEVVKLLPPLTIEPDMLEEGLRRLRSAIEGVLDLSQLRPAA
jgi:diaminobutyrate-2-oxoglutarate transaminase